MKKIPLFKSLIIILASCLCTASLAYFSWSFVHDVKQKRDQDVRFNIIAIAQKCTKGQPLKTAYFAEWLNLSVDMPANLYKFDLPDAKKRLQASPLIASGNLKKIAPNTLFIEYETREPVAFLDDFTNTAIDIYGFIFPFKPFFTPKKLPKIYLGLSNYENSNANELAGWGKSLTGYRFETALKVYRLLMQYKSGSGRTEIIKIDTSKAFDLSYGQREIVVVLHDYVTKDSNGITGSVRYPRMLRLSTEHYVQQLANYFMLKNKFLNESGQIPENASEASLRIIDLRVSDLAFVYQES